MTLAPLLGQAIAADSQSMTLAVHPYLPAAEIVKRFTPLAKEIGKTLGHPVSVRVGRSYAEHIDAIGADRVEIAYMGPVPYVRLVEKYGHKRLLARQEVGGEPFLRGDIVVRDNSPLKTLEDLKGKRFAFGDQDSTMSHVIPLAMLRSAGIEERALAGQRFLGAHRNVALAVIAGDFDAGAVKREVFEEYSRKGLRSLAQLPPVADHLFVAGNTMPEASVVALRLALVRLKDTPAGKAVLNSIHPDTTALVPVDDHDYDSLRKVMSPPQSHRR